MADWLQRLGDETAAGGATPEPAYLRVVASFASLGEALRFTPARKSAKRKEMDVLVRTIEGEIIPRLMLAHRGDDRAVEVAEIEFTADQVDSFVEAALGRGAQPLVDVVRDALDAGVPIESVFVGLLGASARRLGEKWDADELDFCDVAIGLCNLHSVIREVSADVGSGGAWNGRKALFATACGDQHHLGAAMAAEVFRREGWCARCEAGSAASDIAGMLRAEHFDLLALSMSCDRFAPALASEISLFRGASINKNIVIMLAGRIVASRPSLAQEAGADCSAADFKTALAVAAGSLAAPGVPL